MSSKGGGWGSQVVRCFPCSSGGLRPEVCVGSLHGRFRLQLTCGRVQMTAQQHVLAVCVWPQAVSQGCHFHPVYNSSVLST